MKYVEKLNNEQHQLLKNLTGKKLDMLAAPQIIFDPFRCEKTYIFPWLSMLMEAETEKQYLNLSIERLETKHCYDYHRLHISISDKPQCNNGTFSEFPYNENFPAVITSINTVVTDVKTICKVIETTESKEQMEEECIIVITLDNGNTMYLYPQFCGDMVTTGMIALEITKNDKRPCLLKDKWYCPDT